MTLWPAFHPRVDAVARSAPRAFGIHVAPRLEWVTKRRPRWRLRGRFTCSPAPPLPSPRSASPVETSRLRRGANATPPREPSRAWVVGLLEQEAVVGDPGRRRDGRRL